MQDRQELGLKEWRSRATWKEAQFVWVFVSNDFNAPTEARLPWAVSAWGSRIGIFRAAGQREEEVPPCAIHLAW